MLPNLLVPEESELDSEDLLSGVKAEDFWCPAHKGVAGNEKANEWAKIAVEEPDARGVEWLSFLDRAEARGMPLTRSLAHLMLGI